MRALILAAGKTGERDQSPVCLLPLAGKPLIDRQIAALRAGGTTEVGIVRGHHAEMIRRPDVVYFDDDDWSRTDMVMSLATAAEWLRTGPVIVSYPNIFYRGDLVHRLGSVRGTLVAAYDRQWRDLWIRRFGNALEGAETFRRGASGNLLDIGEKTTNADEVEGRYIGLLKFTPMAWQGVETLLSELDPVTRDRMDMKGLLQRLLLAKTVPVGTVGTDGQWGEVSSPDDIGIYEGMVANGELVLED